MLYQFAHFLQSRCSWFWSSVEVLNSLLCGMRIGDVSRLSIGLLKDVRIAKIHDAGRLADFFSEQPIDAFQWFKPHKFDEASLRKLLQRKSYIVYVQEENDEIIGYAFLRCFINEKCFLGKMVDYRHQGKGVSTNLCKVGMNIAERIGFRMFESINKENVGSMKASQKACDVIVVEDFENGDVLIEDRPKGTVYK